MNSDGSSLIVPASGGGSPGCRNVQTDSDAKLGIRSPQTAPGDLVAPKHECRRPRNRNERAS